MHFTFSSTLILAMAVLGLSVTDAARNPFATGGMSKSANCQGPNAKYMSGCSPGSRPGFSGKKPVPGKKQPGQLDLSTILPMGRCSVPGMTKAQIQKCLAKSKKSVPSKKQPGKFDIAKIQPLGR
jgi:hypothetical protein